MFDELHRPHGKDSPFSSAHANVTLTDYGRLILTRNPAAAVEDKEESQREIAMSAGFELWFHHICRLLPVAISRFFLCGLHGALLGASTGERITADLECTELKGFWEAFPDARSATEQAWDSGVTVVHNSCLAIPLFGTGGECWGMLGAVSEVEGLSAETFHLAALSYPPFYQLALENLWRKQLEAERARHARDLHKKETLLQSAQKLFSFIDVNSVMTDLIALIEEFFPGAHIDFLLSQDYHCNELPVKPLNIFDVDNDLCTRAFMEGRLIHSAETGKNSGEMAVPLVGKQGVYGVIQLRSEDVQFMPDDLEFISLVVRIAGGAFENALRFEQSNMLVTELRLINEITKRLNQSLKLGDIFNFACSELINIFDAEFCCILQLDKRSNRMIVQASNLLAMYQEEYGVDYGFSGMVYETKEPLIISDYREYPNVSSRMMELTGSRSLIASPILANEEVVGVILVAHRNPRYFTFENYRLLQTLSGHIGLAIANASLHAEVNRMVITDNLTGLFTRRYLDEQVMLLQDRDLCGSLIVVDIDDFKVINDTYGHQTGDRILMQVSSIIRSSIRETDIAARWGGEEMAIYLPQIGVEQSLRISERIRSRVGSETDPSVTVSCGISDWNSSDEKVSVESLFYKSDMALYRAKHAGKNQIKIG